jgi:hypothetical protein
MTIVPGGYSGGPPSGVPTSPYDAYPAGKSYFRARNALILGLLGIFPFGIVTGIPAVLVGVRALRHIEASEGALKGRGIAWCGIALGCLSVALAVVFYLLLR